jgi:hypothetical protein
MAPQLICPHMFYALVLLLHPSSYAVEILQRKKIIKHTWTHLLEEHDSLVTETPTKLQAGSIYSVGTMTKGLISSHEGQWKFSSCYSECHEVKIYELFHSGIFHLIFSKKCQLKVTKTFDKRLLSFVWV